MALTGHILSVWRAFHRRGPHPSSLSSLPFPGYAAMTQNQHLAAGVLLGLSLSAIGCNSKAPPTPSGTAVTPVTPYVAIIDVDPARFAETEILRVELSDDNAAYLQELYDFALIHFPDEWWSNYGPDAEYREIVFFSRGRKIQLQSWHPIYEQDPRVVASSQGLTNLGGMTRQQFLARDDPEYVRQRNAFDDIEARLRRRYGG